MASEGVSAYINTEQGIRAVLGKTRNRKRMNEVLVWSDSRIFGGLGVKKRGMAALMVSLESRPRVIDAIRMHNAFQFQSSASERIG
jgi:hypothetical protein